MDELAERHELSNEIATAISGPVGYGADIDEQELEDELARLEQKVLSDQMTRVDLPSIPAHPIPTYSQPAIANKGKKMIDVNYKTGHNKENFFFFRIMKHSYFFLLINIIHR
jgi:hypothetical protein